MTTHATQAISPRRLSLLIEQAGGPLDADELIDGLLQNGIDRIKEAAATRVAEREAVQEELREAAEEVGRQLLSDRRLVDGHYGPDLAAELFSPHAPTAGPPSPPELWRHCRDVVERLRNADLERIGRLPGRCPIDVEAMAARLENAAARLKAAIASGSRSGRQAAAQMNLAVAAADAEARSSFRLAADLLRKVGQPRLARRIETALLRVSPAARP